MRTRAYPAAIVPAFVLALGIAACGGSSSTSMTTHQQTSSATTASASAAGSGSSVSTGAVRGTLTAANHAPTAGRPWHYTVKVSDAGGSPLSGTVEIEFTFAGQMVGRDTPPTHAVRAGRWQDNLKFPGAAIGQPLTVRAVVHTRLGSITLDWPVTVHK